MAGGATPADKTARNHRAGALLDTTLIWLKNDGSTRSGATSSARRLHGEGRVKGVRRVGVLLDLLQPLVLG